MIDITQEQLIRLAEAARLAGPGRGNRPTHLSTVLRWILDGVRTPTGIIKLEACRIGCRWMTSAAAMQRFAAALTLGADNLPQPRTPTARKHASDRAKKRLERLGI